MTFVGRRQFTINAEKRRKMKISKILSAHFQIMGFIQLSLQFQNKIFKTHEKILYRKLKVGGKSIYWKKRDLRFLIYL